MERLYKCIATFFYLGFSPYAPGTAGTLGAATLYALLWWADWARFPALLAILAGSSILNVCIGGWAEEYFHHKDPQPVVIDEVAGFFLTVLAFRPSWAVLAGGFILFRIFDIAKPYPIHKLEALPKGLGILLDDLGAAIYAAAVLMAVSAAAHGCGFASPIEPWWWQWANVF